MLNYLKSKIVIAFAIFGAVLALVLGVFSRVSIPWLVVRVMAGGLLMGSLGFGLDFFLRQSLPPEDYEDLFRKKTPDESGAGPAAPGLDIVDEPGLAPDQEYSALYKDTGPAGAAPEHPGPDENRQQDNGRKSEPSGGARDEGSFQPDDVESIPRVARKLSEEIDSPRAPGSSASPNDMSREEKIRHAFAERSVSASGDPSVKFRMGAKNVTADPKVIAKAIRTVLQRDK